MASKSVDERGRKQLLGYLINECQSQDATRDWVMTWIDTWCPVDPALIARVMAKVAPKSKRAKKTKGGGSDGQ